jgi:hypothetical protein
VNWRCSQVRPNSCRSAPLGALEADEGAWIPESHWANGCDETRVAFAAQRSGRSVQVGRRAHPIDPTSVQRESTEQLALLEVVILGGKRHVSTQPECFLSRLCR